MATSGVPEQFHSVTPSIAVTPAAEAIEFYKKAFGAEEIEPRMTGPDGRIGHAEIRIGDSVIMLADEWPDGPTKAPTSLDGSTAALFIYTDDVDSMWQQAIEAGAKEVFPLQLQFYDDKSGRIRDPYGHTWGLRRRVEDVSPQDMERRMAQFYEEERSEFDQRDLWRRPATEEFGAIVANDDVLFMDHAPTRLDGQPRLQCQHHPGTQNGRVRRSERWRLGQLHSQPVAKPAHVSCLIAVVGDDLGHLVVDVGAPGAGNGCGQTGVGSSPKDLVGSTGGPGALDNREVAIEVTEVPVTSRTGVHHQDVPRSYRDVGGRRDHV